MVRSDQHMSRPRRGQIVLYSAAIFLVVSACGGGDADPSEVLQDYQEARNSGDVDAVMGLYAEDAVVENHPRDSDGVANGVLEIRILEAQVPGLQGSTGGIEFTDLVVSGNTETFKETFFNEDGDCFSAAGNEVTVEDDKITLYVWGQEEDPSLCG